VHVQKALTRSHEATKGREEISESRKEVPTENTEDTEDEE
jgi:hypothetical protein